MKKKIVSLLVVSFFILFSISCSLLDYIPLVKRNTPVPEPTEAPIVVITEAPVVDMPVVTEEPTNVDMDFFLYDDFSSNVNNWAEGEMDGDYARAIYSFEDDMYKWDVYSHQLANVTSWPDSKKVGDFTCSVLARQTGEDPDDSDYGLIYRDPNSGSFLSYGITNKDYSIYVYDAYTAEWTEIIPWTTSEAVYPGEYNYMEMSRVGNLFSISVNGQELDTFTYSDIQLGQLGLNVDIFPANVTGTFEFDDFLVTSP